MIHSVYAHTCIHVHANYNECIFDGRNTSMLIMQLHSSTHLWKWNQALDIWSLMLMTSSLLPSKCYINARFTFAFYEIMKSQTITFSILRFHCWNQLAEFKKGQYFINRLPCLSYRLGHMPYTCLAHFLNYFMNYRHFVNRRFFYHNNPKSKKTCSQNIL